MIIAQRLTIPIIGGPMDGQYRPLSGVAFTESVAGTRWLYRRSVDDGEIVWRVVGVVGQTSARDAVRALNLARVRRRLGDWNVRSLMRRW